MKEQINLPGTENPEIVKEAEQNAAAENIAELADNVSNANTMIEIAEYVYETGNAELIQMFNTARADQLLHINPALAEEYDIEPSSVEVEGESDPEQQLLPKLKLDADGFVTKNGERDIPISAFEDGYTNAELVSDMKKIVLETIKPQTT